MYENFAYGHIMTFKIVVSDVEYQQILNRLKGKCIKASKISIFNVISRLYNLYSIIYAHDL